MRFNVTVFAVLWAICSASAFADDYSSYAYSDGVTVLGRSHSRSPFLACLDAGHSVTAVGVAARWHYRRLKGVARRLIPEPVINDLALH